MLDFALDRDAEVPLGVQLAWALRTRIGDGRFAPGSRLPGLRDLADALAVNANTIRAVYRRLEQEGLIESRQGSGTFVAPTAPGQAAANMIAARAAAQAQETGVDPRDVAAALYVGLQGEGRDVDPEAMRRTRLRAQIAALEQTLVELEAQHPGLIPGLLGVGEPEGRDRASVGGEPEGGGARLPDAAELEQVRLRLVRRLAAMQAAIDSLGDPEQAGGSERSAGAKRPADAPAHPATAGGAKRRAARSAARPAAAGA